MPLFVCKHSSFMRLAGRKHRADMLSQIIFTTHASDSLSLKDYLEIGLKNDAICKSLGFTGRLFVIDNQHLNIIEGSCELNEDYYTAFVNDPRAVSAVRHFSRDIKEREFCNYAVWVNHSGIETKLPAPLQTLSANNLDLALPEQLSLKLKLMIDSYVRPNLAISA